MKRMTIKGSEWHRGGRSNEEGACLLTKSGLRCCVGIHARLCGMEDDHIRGVSWPKTMPIELFTNCFRPWLAERFAESSDPYIGNAAQINDDEYTTDEEKIEALRPIFRQLDVTIVWRPDL